MIRELRRSESKRKCQLRMKEGDLWKNNWSEGDLRKKKKLGNKKVDTSTTRNEKLPQEISRNIRNILPTP